MVYFGEGIMCETANIKLVSVSSDREIVKGKRKAFSIQCVAKLLRVE